MLRFQRSWSSQCLVHGDVHWRAPTAMIFCSVLGISVALVHHFFYNYMDKQVVGENQQWVTRAGTAAAFIVKLSLATATSIAYIQWLWFRLKTGHSTIEQLDSMFAVLGNAWEFLNLRFWLSRPLLTLSAAVTWLLPLSAIITPGTIIVQSTSYATQQPLTVTQRDYVTGEYYNFVLDGNTTVFQGAESVALPPVLFFNMAEGSLTTIPRDESDANITYTLAFEGPAITCSQVGNPTADYIGRALEEYQNMTQSRVTAASFVPQPGFGADMNGSFFNQSEVFTPPAGGASVLDTISEDASTIYMAVTVNFNVLPYVISCAYMNASYIVQFDLLANGQQHVTAETKFLNWITTQGKFLGLPYDNATLNTTLNFQALIYDMNFFMIGDISEPLGPNSTTGPGVTSIELEYASPKIRDLMSNVNNTESLDAPMSGLESIFQNFTLSARYGPIDHVTPSARQQLSNTITNATFFRFQNQYLYKPKDLLIAYGISIFWALICIALGAVAINSNGGSYSNNFSTVVRVSRGPELDRLIEEGADRSGADPLPDHIAEAEVTFGGQAEKVERLRSNTLLAG
ncbi:hypothetical protein AOQ84DRAFT_419192 [Glonium stellatum]|uniref:Uncharacterized protein n=1 Tax=Glonium stellatum TaxID=574774 RepID=A0A8E2ER98_9PEZI|nr:hypothetical protein AOQ84DRAFT_419192 [Glonium stellatum]